MIAESSGAKLAACLLATALIVGGLHLRQPHVATEISGGGAVQAKLGSTFEDMTAGVLSAVQTTTQTRALPPTDAAPHPEVLQVPRLKSTEAPSRQPPIQQVSPTAPRTVTAAAPNLSSLKPTAPIMSERSLTSSASPILRPTQATPQPDAAPQTITAKVSTTTAPPLSARPKRRDPDKAQAAADARPKPQSTRKQAATTKPKAQRGNAKRNNTQGAANGTQQPARAKSQGTARKAAVQSGNAAASNYPGLVMRRIARVPKPRVNARGTTVVAFSISRGGGLGALSVVRSSGSAALDKAALRVIRKASPFPKPPQGAKRSFSIRIKGR